jgi:O-antigen/teichoic acid export membrane protein
MAVESEVVATELAKNHLGQIGRGVRLNLIGAFVTAVANLGLVVVLAHDLTRSAAGLFFTATSLFLLASILAQLGTRTGLVYHVSRLRALNKTELIPDCLSIGLRPVAVAGGISAALLAITGEIWMAAGSSATAAAMAHQLWVLAPFLPLAALSDSFLSGTRGFGTMKPTLVIEGISRNGVQFVLCAIVATLTSHLTLIALVWALPYAGSSAWGALRLRGLTARTVTATTRPPRPAGFTREFWRFTAPRAFASIAQMLLQRLDIVLVAALRGPVDAAVYTAATRLLVSGQLGGQAISGSVQPKLAEALSARDIPNARSSYQTATCWLVLLTWPFYLLCIVDVHLFLRIFGHGYVTASGVGVLLAMSMLVATACGMVDLVLTMGGKTSWNLANTLGALAINVIVDVILIPPYGIMGAAIGWAAAIVFNNLVPLAQIWRAMRLHPFGKPTLLAFAVTTVIFGAIPWSVALAANRGLTPSLVALVASLAVYGVALAALWNRLHLGELIPTKRLQGLAFWRRRVAT